MEIRYGSVVLGRRAGDIREKEKRSLNILATFDYVVIHRAAGRCPAEIDTGAGRCGYCQAGRRVDKWRRRSEVSGYWLISIASAGWFGRDEARHPTANGHDGLTN